jgi:thiol peroxidase
VKTGGYIIRNFAGHQSALRVCFLLLVTSFMGYLPCKSLTKLVAQIDLSTFDDNITFKNLKGENNMERTGLVTFAGNPLTLTGKEVKVGKKAPDFTVLNKELKEVKLTDFAGKTKIISVTPSLDTPVCDMQARRFNQEAQSLSKAITVLNISMDLPFALARFCTSAGIDNVETLSDHRDASFGKAYGVLVKELRLLARAIFVVDASDVVRYMEIVPEMTNQPDYDKTLEEAKKAAG